MCECGTKTRMGCEERRKHTKCPTSVFWQIVSPSSSASPFASRHVCGANNYMACIDTNESDSYCSTLWPLKDPFNFRALMACANLRILLEQCLSKLEPSF